MAQDAGEIRVAPQGDIYVAPVGTTKPADETAAWPAGWVNLGFTTEDGVSWTDTKEITLTRAWQSYYPLRRNVSNRDFTIKFGMLQWSRATFMLAFGGPTVTEPASGHYKVEAPEPSYIDYRMVGVEWADGDFDYRLIMNRAINQENVETSLKRDTASILPVTMGLIGVEDEAAWLLLTNDPSFA